MASQKFYNEVTTLVNDHFYDCDGRMRGECSIVDEIIEWLEGKICPAVVEAAKTDCADCPNVIFEAFETVMGTKDE